MKKTLTLLLAFLFIIPSTFSAEEKDTASSSIYNGLKWRNIGPAFTSGRISDIAVNPINQSEYYVAVSSGNVWKTTNRGITFQPIFENYGAYSTSCLAIDPDNPNVIWLGTGENNHQRALGYGDGVYKSIDAGKSWKNMGLKESRQIGKIVIDPRNTNIVFVAAEGSVWGPGGERGLYKTIDGGNTWKLVLEISKHTGVNEVVLDPRNPDVMYATSEQRRRHTFTKIGGGPESAVYKSTDAGETWNKIMKGLPKVDIGGMGLDISPANPEYIYLSMEAADEKGGFFRSTNRGASWEKMSDRNASGQYFNEIFCDPKDENKVYLVDVRSEVTHDGGKTWQRLSTENRHVDDHEIWINPTNTDNFLIGGDGGIYETYDAGKTFDFKDNLPVTQFYRVFADNSEPFYYVYGGTQDNSSMGGPSQTLSADGIVNSDWFVTNGGDGFWSAVDPEDPNIVYAESQYAGMVRYNRETTESIYITPEPKEGELTYKWNWDTPLFISPHNNKRLYCAANKVFRTEDRGNSWQVISEDLTAQVDRNTWPVMDKFWSVDAVAKDRSTSLWGTIVSLSESRIKENLLYSGTDDGIIHVSEDAKTWTKYSKFPGVPEFSYVSDILPSKFDENVVFATFNNHKRDDFKPYVLMSSNKGKSWKSISANLPVNGPVHTIEQDFKNPNLLFVGTEFGVFFSNNSGESWTQLKSGIPTISVKDIAIQEREEDLVLATFGRGFFILDDYSPLRSVDEKNLLKEGFLFPIKDAKLYVQSRGRYGQGSNYFKADNPEFGATFTYFLKEVPKTLKSIRHDKEKALFKEGKQIPQPSNEELRLEKNEVDPYLIFVIKDQKNNVVRKLTTGACKGIQRVVWDLRHQSLNPLSEKDKFNPKAKPQSSTLVMPGQYNVSMILVTRDGEQQISESVFFNVVPLKKTKVNLVNNDELFTFQEKANELARTISGTERYLNGLIEKVDNLKQSILTTPDATIELLKDANRIALELDDLYLMFNRESKYPSMEENPPSHNTINERLSVLRWTHWRSTEPITEKEKRNYNILMKEFPPVHERIKQISEIDIVNLEKKLESLGAPYTPGRLPVLKQEN